MQRAGRERRLDRQAGQNGIVVKHELRRPQHKPIRRTHQPGVDENAVFILQIGAHQDSGPAIFDSQRGQITGKRKLPFRFGHTNFTVQSVFPHRNAALVELVKHGFRHIAAQRVTFRKIVEVNKGSGQGHQAVDGLGRVNFKQLGRKFPNLEPKLLRFGIPALRIGMIPARNVNQPTIPIRHKQAGIYMLRRAEPAASAAVFHRGSVHARRGAHCGWTAIRGASGKKRYAQKRAKHEIGPLRM